MQNKWVILTGDVTVKNPTDIRANGGSARWTDDNGKEFSDGFVVAEVLSNAKFNAGKVSAVIRFSEKKAKQAAGITLASNPELGAHLTVMLGFGPLCSVRLWPGHRSQDGAVTTKPVWRDFATVGTEKNLEPDRDYFLQVTVKGSQILVHLDGVQLINTDLKDNVPKYSLGAWFFSQKPIDFSSFNVITEKPSAFVIMEFTPSFDELYAEVIKPVCEAFDIRSIRADERFGPGAILADVQRQIIESAVVVADITPVNANVFYEVGFAHALNKPTILLAQRGTKLPFDVSGFRTIFYDNTIKGKSKVEEGLRMHLDSVFGGA